MRTVARHARLLLVLVLAAPTGLAAQGRGGGGGAVISQVPGDAPKGTGLLLGQVVDAGTGRPIGGAIVTLTGTASAANQQMIEAGMMAPAAGGSTRQILTDSEGRFMFRELPQGRYNVRATAPGYLGGNLGQTRPTGGGQQVELTTDDDKKGDLVVRMWKSASLAGTILDEIGEPVPGVYVRLLRRSLVGGSVRLVSSSSANTDDRGMYRIAGLTPGDYLVGVFTTQAAMPIATSDAYMQAMSTSGGTTSDLYRELSSSGVTSVIAMGGYRVGDFVMTTGNRGFDAGPTPPINETRLMTYQTQYYPASFTPSHATVVTLGSGDERSGIDLQLKLVPSVKVTGVVIGPDGPVRNLGLRLLPAEANSFSTESGAESATTVSDAAGAFTFLGVVPGQYTLKALRVPRPITTSSGPSTMIEISSGSGGMIMGMSTGSPSTAPPPPLPKDATLWAEMPVAVSDTDLSGVTVTLRPGVRISGHLEFVGTKDKPTPDQLQRTTLSINPLVGSLLPSTPAKRFEGDGRFSTVGFPPGRYTVTATLLLATAALGGASAWTFRNATVGGRDVSNEGLDITGEDIADLVITFTDQTTDLTGQVTDAKGQQDKSAIVVVFPADTDSWKRGVMNVRRMRSTRTSTTGAYSLPNLPPGTYYIAALPDATMPEWQDPKILEALLSVATRFTLDEGEKKSQDLSTRTIRY